MKETKCYLSTHEKHFADTWPGTGVNIIQQFSISICNLLYISVTVLGYQMSPRPHVGVLGSNIITWGNICWDGKKAYENENFFHLPRNKQPQNCNHVEYFRGPVTLVLCQCNVHHVCAAHTKSWSGEAGRQEEGNGQCVGRPWGRGLGIMWAWEGRVWEKLCHARVLWNRFDNFAPFFFLIQLCLT